MIQQRTFSIKSVNWTENQIKNVVGVLPIGLAGRSELGGDSNETHDKRRVLIREWFAKLVELSGEEQAACLDELRELDESVAAEVQALVERDRDNAQFLEGSPQIDLGADETHVWRIPPEIPGYTSIQHISEGGQAVVFQGRQESTNQLVAIKVLKDGFLGGSSARERHLEEIRSLTRIQHPNIVSVVDCGSTEDGREYYITRFISGQNLDEYILAENLTIEQRVSLCAKIARALDAAHHSGIAHRDLKPSNIRIDRHGEPHILDFGLAKGIEAGTIVNGDLKTESGSFVGSVNWASPEQIDKRFGKISLRTDIYQLGVVFFQVFAGCKFPYDVSGEFLESFQSILQANPKSIPGAENDIKLARVNKVIRKALRKKQEERFTSAGAFARTLEKAIVISDQKADGKKERPAIVSWIFLVGFLLVGLFVAALVIQWLYPAQFDQAVARIQKTLSSKSSEHLAKGEPQIEPETTAVAAEIEHPPFMVDWETPITPDMSNNTPPVVTENSRKFASVPTPLEPVQISMSDVKLPEGQTGSTQATFEVQLSRASAEKVHVDYATSDETAHSSSSESRDYKSISRQSLTFEPGETSKKIVIDVLGDSEWEREETFAVKLSNPKNAEISKGKAVCTIQNDDVFVSEHGELDFRKFDGLRLKPWDFKGNFGVSINQGIPSLRIVGAGGQDHSAINRSIKLGGEFFIEAQLWDNRNSEAEFILQSSTTAESLRFSLKTIAYHDWGAVGNSGEIQDLAPGSVFAKKSVWLRVEQIPGEGVYVFANGDRSQMHRIAVDMETPFDSLEIRFPNEKCVKQIQNLRWGPIETTPLVETKPFGDSSRQTSSGEIPQGWVAIGTSREGQPRRFISEDLQIGEDFNVSFTLDVKRIGSFALNFVGDKGSVTLPVYISIEGYEAKVSLGGATKSFQYEFGAIDVRIVRTGDRIQLEFGGPQNVIAIEPHGLKNFSRLELDLIKTDGAITFQKPILVR
ncbi:protein kinase domain-containing protein [Thalassoglobus sp.]|uniref:protein kinase domain-containing protein n=1 Tax=Thalassoglobus sp. TaxID=2795869 RepID=UPI003AA987F6